MVESLVLRGVSVNFALCIAKRTCYKFFEDTSLNHIFTSGS